MLTRLLANVLELSFHINYLYKYRYCNVLKNLKPLEGIVRLTRCGFSKVIVDNHSRTQKRELRVDLERHALIKARLEIAGWSLSALSKSIGVAQSSVSTVSQGYRRSHKIQSAIAEILGTTPEALWPDRYPQTEASQEAQ
ncbi:helix-turn-helix domain-containing protein [Octadecabacter ascidiaceicola]|uniref:helix-turn-helix domain-containing protein n=1 Tax=Octadecabacter ascidiaceicola TaxID=1655543 RepID=UPI000B8B4C8A